MSKKIIDNFLLESILGSGQYGKVYKALNLSTSEYFALKSIKIAHLQKLNLIPSIENEVLTLKSLENPHIIRLFSLKQTSTHYYFLYEYCNNDFADADRFYFKRSCGMRYLQE